VDTTSLSAKLRDGDDCTEDEPNIFSVCVLFLSGASPGPLMLLEGLGISECA
jgi:hypothetical protein